QVVEKEQELQQLAIKSYQSYIKAYSSHSRETKFIFHTKNLHLGHVAKSFALKEKPSEFKKKLKHNRDEEETEVKQVTKKRKLNPNERVEQYKQYQMGKLQSERPKIILPESLRSKK